MEMGRLVFDIDGTICSQEPNYEDARPFKDMIEKINRKYDEGYTIVFWTARGSETGIDWTEITKAQLKAWDVKYHQLIFGKPAAALYVDDKAINTLNYEPSIAAEEVVYKNWGTEYLLSKSDKYAFKRLEINDGECISKQIHECKNETWHIIEGTGVAYVNNKKYLLYPGVTIDIPKNSIHQAMATDHKLVIMEASTSELDDIIRLKEGEFDYSYLFNCRGWN